MVPKIRIVDSSLLILLDQYDGLKQFCDDCSSKKITTITSPKVFEETVSNPRRLARYKDSADKIEQTIFESGIVRVEKVIYDPFISMISDRARDLIAKRSGVARHRIERADLEIISLAFTHLKNGGKTEVIFRDRAMRHALVTLAKRYDREKNIEIIDILPYFRRTLKILR
ncbi:MAG: hypothetical protein ACRD5H_07750 [Nitrososphaerales archaeon]